MTPSHLTDGVRQTTGPTATTASISPTANALLIATVVARQYPAGIATPVLSGLVTGAGWTLRVTTGNRQDSLLYVFTGTASGSSGTISFNVTSTAEVEVGWHISQVIGTIGTPNVLQALANDADGGFTPTASVAMSALANSANRVFAASTWADANLVSPDAAFTELAETGWSFDARKLHTQIGPTNDNTPSATMPPGGADWQMAVLELDEGTSPATLEQEGFRFGADDGNEAAHGWLAGQDTNAAASVNTRLLIRALINATDNPEAQAFTLRSQKNGSGGYTAVPVGSGTAEQLALPTWGAQGTGSTGTNSCTPSYPTGIAALTSKLLMGVTGRSNTANTTVATPTGWTLVGTLEDGTGVWGVDTGPRRVTFFRKDTVTGSESGTVAVAYASGTNAASTIYASIFRIEVPSGYDLDVAFSAGADTTNDTGYSATGSTALALDANRLLIIMTAQNIDSGTKSSQSITASGITFGTRTNRRDIATTQGNDHRHTIDSVPVSSGSGTVAPTWSYTISAAGSGPTAFLSLRARLPAVVNQVYVDASANITAGGEATTARLTAPSGKSTSDFVTGRRWDNENGTDTIDLPAGDYTEVEWAINTQSPVVDGDYFDFRVYAGATPLDTYTVTPRLTIGSGGEDAAGTLVAPGVTLGATVSVRRTASGSLVTTASVLAGAATVERAAAGTLHVPPAVLSGSFAVARDASGAFQAPPASLAAAAALERHTSAALTPGALTLAAAAAAAREAQGTLQVPVPTLAGLGTVTRDAAGALTLPGLTVSADGSITRLASLDAQMAPPVLAASVSAEAKTAAGVLAVPPTALDAAAAIARDAQGALQAPAPALAATSTITRDLVGALETPSLDLAATGTIARAADAALDIPSPTLVASTNPTRQAGAVLETPALTLSAVSTLARAAAGELEVPAPTLTGASAVARETHGALVVPRPTLAADAGLARDVQGTLHAPAPDLATAAAVTRDAAGALALPPSVLAATSAVARTVASAPTLPVPALTGAATVVRRVAGVLEVTGPVLTAAVDTGRTVSGGLQLPPVTVSAATPRVVAATGTLPVPAVDLTAALAVARFASGELALVVPVLTATAADEATTVTAALTLPVPVLSGDILVRHQATGAARLAGPVLSGDVVRAVEVDGLLVLRPMTLAAQTAIAHLAAGDLEAGALVLQAQLVIGALQPLLLTVTGAIPLTPEKTVTGLVGTQGTRSLVGDRTVEPR